MRLPLPKSESVALSTPVSWTNLQFLLNGYDEVIAKALVRGFKYGFSIHFSCDLIYVDYKTLISASQNPDRDSRMAGPFDSEPFDADICIILREQVCICFTIHGHICDPSSFGIFMTYIPADKQS